MVICKAERGPDVKVADVPWLQLGSDVERRAFLADRLGVNEELDGSLSADPVGFARLEQLTTEGPATVKGTLSDPHGVDDAAGT